MQSKPLTSHLVCIIYFYSHYRLWVLESFNDAHEKKKIVILQLIKRLMLNFLGQLSIGRNTERGGYFCQCPGLRLNLIDLKNHELTFLLEHTEYGFSFKS